MRFFLLYIEIFICVMFSWMLALRLSVVSGLSATVTILIFFALMIPMFLLFYFRSWRKLLHKVPRQTTWYIVGVLVIGLIIGGFVLVVARPDPDDVGYLNSLLTDIQNFDEPITGYQFWLPGATDSIEHERIFAHEALVVVFSKLLGGDPLGSYHNIGAFFAAVTWAITYALFFRQIGLRRKEVWLAVMISFVFLLLDGNIHRSYGNFTFVRIWQGKVILTAIMVPLATALSLRFLQRPSYKRFLILFMTFFCMSEYSRTGILLAAILVVAIALAYIFTHGFRHHFRRPLLLVASAIYPIALGISIFIGAIVPTVIDIINETDPSQTEVQDGSELEEIIVQQPRLNNEDAIETLAIDREERLANLVLSPANYPSNWFDNIFETVMGTPEVLVRNLFLLLLLPFFTLPRPYNLLIPLISFSIIVLVVNPLTGQLAISMIGNHGYWRIYYLFPVPMCAGLIAMVIHRYRTRNRQLLAWGASIAAIVMIAIAYKGSVLERDNVFLKSPVEYRLGQEEWRFVQSIIDDIRGLNVMASDPIANVLALTYIDELGSLAYPRKPVNARTRITRMEEAITRCRPDIEGESYTAIQEELETRDNLDAFIITSCEDAATYRAILNVIGDDWYVYKRSNGYALLFKRSDNSE